MEQECAGSSALTWVASVTMASYTVPRGWLLEVGSQRVHSGPKISRCPTQPLDSLDAVCIWESSQGVVLQPRPMILQQHCHSVACVVQQLQSASLLGFQRKQVSGCSGGTHRQAWG